MELRRLTKCTKTHLQTFDNSNIFLGESYPRTSSDKGRGKTGTGKGGEGGRGHGEGRERIGDGRGRRGRERKGRSSQLRVSIFYFK
jgi:hypothetical protein